MIDGTLTTTYSKGGKAMPLGPDVKYRFKKGTHTRLAFDASGKVIEAKNFTSGKVHTPAEFEEDAETSSKTQNAREEKKEGQKRYLGRK